MIRTLADDATREIWNGVNSKAARGIPRELWPIVRRKLDQIDAVTRLDDLKVPPGNRLHGRGSGRRGFHAVRVNDQYRIVFRFDGAAAVPFQRLNVIVKGRRPVSADTALLLEALTGWDAHCSSCAL